MSDSARKLTALPSLRRSAKLEPYWSHQRYGDRKASTKKARLSGPFVE